MDNQSSLPFAQPNRRKSRWIAPVSFGVVVLMLGLGLDIIAHAFLDPSFPLIWWKVRLCENTTGGIIAGIFAYYVLLDREQRLERRFREIAYLNHHIRNALSAIVLSQNVEIETKQRIEMVKDSSDRIRLSLEKITRAEDIGDFRDNPQKP